MMIFPDRVWTDPTYHFFFSVRKNDRFIHLSHDKKKLLVVEGRGWNPTQLLHVGTFFKINHYKRSLFTNQYHSWKVSKGSKTSPKGDWPTPHNLTKRFAEPSSLVPPGMENTCSLSLGRNTRRGCGKKAVKVAWGPVANRGNKWSDMRYTWGPPEKNGRKYMDNWWIFFPNMELWNPNFVEAIFIVIWKGSHNPIFRGLMMTMVIITHQKNGVTWV